ncbi:glycyl radical protein [Enterococcus florum]|nr:pyruvate formate lyase family protein [Enterococcus florum]
MYFNRIEARKAALRSVQPEIDLENARILTQVFRETDGEAVVIQKAKAFRAQCREKTIEIFNDELIVGCPGSKLRGGLISVDTCWTILADELDTISQRENDPFQLREEDRALFLSEIQPYWQGRSVYEAWQKRIPPQTKILRDAGVIQIDKKVARGFGDVTAGYKQILREGLEGIKETINQKKRGLIMTDPGAFETNDYLNALLIAIEGLEILADRYAEEAIRLADQENDPKRKQELLMIANVCRHVPKYPAVSFHEALQAVYFYHMALFMEQNAQSYNPGRMDQYLYPYLQKDLAEERLTPDQAQELLDCLWIKFNETCIFQDAATAQFVAGYPMLQNVCVGGINQLGQDAVNELSYMIIQAAVEVQLFQPSLSIRYNLAKNPNRFLRKVVELMQLGMGFPAFHNDDIGIRMMMNKGVPLKEAYDWNPCGCVETNLEGRMKQYTSLADINLGSVCELTLTNGIDRASGQRLTPETGDPRSFADFEAFKEAVKQQLSYVIKVCVQGSHVIDEISLKRPVPVLSLSHKECIERGLDYSQGGAKYNCGNGITSVGVADLINTLVAVQTLVYQEKAFTMDTLLMALAHDFEGYEDILELCQKAPKYGNADQRVHELTSEMFVFIADEIEQYHSKFGKMTAGILPVTGNILSGLFVGALPSGRKAGTPLADGITPSVGTDLGGSSGILQSAAQIPHDRFVQGTLMNMKVDPELIQHEQGIAQLMVLLKSICTLGIFHVFIHIIDRDTLLRAQKYPEEYQGLLIRVAGYTAYFVELDKHVQDEIIGRTPKAGLVAGEPCKERY